MDQSQNQVGLALSLEPMGLETAQVLRRRLLAGFPFLKAHDPDGYQTALDEVLSGYPRFAGERTIQRVDEERPEFPPSDRQLRSWLDDAVRPYRYAQEWNSRTKKQLAEREATEAAAGNLPIEPRGHIFTNYHEAVAANGGRPPIGPFDPGRKLLYRGGM